MTKDKLKHWQVYIFVLFLRSIFDIRFKRDEYHLNNPDNNWMLNFHNVLSNGIVHETCFYSRVSNDLSSILIVRFRWYRSQYFVLPIAKPIVTCDFVESEIHSYCIMFHRVRFVYYFECTCFGFGKFKLNTQLSGIAQWIRQFLFQTVQHGQSQCLQIRWKLYEIEFGWHERWLPMMIQ
jgi:hypothetical protein